jgi:hypothetical protein
MRGKFVLLVILAIIAMFSFPNGAFAWVLSFPLFLAMSTIRTKAKKSIVWLCFWFLAAGGCAGLYLLDYQEPMHTPRILTGFHPFLYLEYAIVFLGGSLFRVGPDRATLIPFCLGVFLLAWFVCLACYLFIVRRPGDLRERCAPWLAFGAFGIGSAALCAIGRRPYYTAEQALDSRYTTFSLTLVLSLIGLSILAYPLLKERFSRSGAKWLPWLVGTLFAVLVSGYLANVPFAFQQMASAKAYHLDSKAALQYSRVLRDPSPAEAIMTTILYSDITSLRAFVTMLDAVDLIRPPLRKDPRMVESKPPSRGQAALKGRFESISGFDDDRYAAVGWTVLPGRHGRADGVVLAYLSPEKNWIALTMVTERKDRPDIKELLHDRSLKDIGWRIIFSKALLPAEARELSAWAIDATTGNSYRLEQTQTIPGLSASNKLRENIDFHQSYTGALVFSP